ncbi:HNH endonuclease [Nonomuraea insulae]|uniref:HNH endonuclease n=1 Tax=Nonomuraea insulae TaxID=1616787 RepID=A0ABW1D194_9ACTN
MRHSGFTDQLGWSGVMETPQRERREAGRMSRRFNQSQRAALFLAAEGLCMRCGAELQRGWHGDHVTPYSKGGRTDVVNGEALCPECNLSER